MKWKNRPARSNTWEAIENIVDVRLLEKFEEQEGGQVSKKAKTELTCGDPESSERSATAVNRDSRTSDPNWTNHEVVVTDITAKEETFTFLECRRPEGFFRRKDSKKIRR